MGGFSCFYGVGVVVVCVEREEGGEEEEEGCFIFYMFHVSFISFHFFFIFPCCHIFCHFSFFIFHFSHIFIFFHFKGSKPIPKQVSCLGRW